MFNSTGPHYCKDCKPKYLTNRKTKKRRITRPELELIESNWHGTGADMANCSECGHSFCITYRVDTITRNSTDWDGPSRAELEAEAEAERLKKIEEEKELLRQLAEKYPDEVKHDRRAD